MWMNVDIFCFIVVFYVASLASPQIWKKNPDHYRRIMDQTIWLEARPLVEVLENSWGILHEGLGLWELGSNALVTKPSLIFLDMKQKFLLHKWVFEDGRVGLLIRVALACSFKLCRWL
jgi:hypothetical protein